MIGVVMLMGLVTKNAILLVDYTNQLHREEGLSVDGRAAQGGPGPAAADPDDDDGDDPRHAAVGAGHAAKAASSARRSRSRRSAG